MKAVLYAITAIIGATLVGTSLPRVDETRGPRAIDNALVFVPDGKQLVAASSGQAEVLADLLWVRAVLLFGERYDSATGTAWTDWLRRMILAVNTLDPHWRTAYFYGGSLLRVVEDIEGADMVFLQATQYLPEDSFFPFSLGMNAYLYREDPEEAGRWLEKAAVLPNAPGWYGAAAAAMHQEAGARDSAIRFLEELAASTNNEGVRKDSKRQLRRLHHNAMVDEWAPRCKAFKEEQGRPLSSPDELAQLLGRPLPENPRGDAWIVGQDGVVRSARADRERLRRLRKAEWLLVRR